MAEPGWLLRSRGSENQAEVSESLDEGRFVVVSFLNGVARVFDPMSLLDGNRSRVIAVRISGEERCGQRRRNRGTMADAWLGIGRHYRAVVDARSSAGGRIGRHLE